MSAKLEYGENYVHLHCDTCENNPDSDDGFCFEWTPEQIKNAMPLVHTIMNKHNSNYHEG